MNKKGTEQLADWGITVFLLFISFIFSLIIIGLSHQSTEVHYETNLVDLHNQRALNLYLKQPLQQTSFEKILIEPEQKNELITVITKNYFNTFFGAENWWSINLQYPDREDKLITSEGILSGQELAGKTYLPTEKGLLTITLFRDKHKDVLFLVTVNNNPLLAIYYLFFG